MNVSAAAPRAATLPPTAATSTLPLGGKKGGGIQFELKHMLLFAGIGALAGLVVPVIPGGPIGGALLGAALSFVI